ncbi:MAG: type II secretion system protein GspE, partial [Chlamydiae bacterium CG10_big_fil_rev_8_21_14_0_10_35_9]
MNDIEQIASLLSITALENLEDFRFIKERITRVPYLFAKEKKILPIDETADKILVATSDPLNIHSMHDIGFYLNKQVEPCFCSSEILEEAIERCYQKENPKEDRSTDSQEYDLLAEKSDNPVIQFLNRIFQEAVTKGASDIHFEPQENELTVRYRIDGVLQKRYSPSKKMQAQLVTRIKVLAKLDIAEQRLPQDGRIKIKLKEKEIDFRVSTIPTIFGERVVLRILDKGNIALGLDHIGLAEADLK